MFGTIEFERWLPCRWRGGTAIGAAISVAVSLSLPGLPAPVSAAGPLGGSVRAWGANWHGQLGAWLATSGGLSSSGAPACPPSVDNVIGGCYVGGVLGANGPNPNPLPDPVPNPVLTLQAGAPLLSGVTAVAAGYAHSLALRSDQTVLAWGGNSRGELGNGSTYDNSTAIVVAGLSGITAIAAGAGFSMALRSDGTVWTWGSNQYGQLGDNGPTGPSAYSPVPVQVRAVGGTGNLNGVTAIAAGANHALALKSDQTVVSWGYNVSGQLGNGTMTMSTVPVAVSSLTQVTSISAGSSHSLAVKAGASTSANTVWSWGSNDYGQLGNNSSTGSTVPVQVVAPGGSGTLMGVVSVAAGYLHSLALAADQSVVAWGYNNDGELGIGSTTNSAVPVQISGLAGVTRLAGGGFHSLALGPGGVVSAWGSNQYGQLGAVATAIHTGGDPSAAYSYSATPVAVLGLTGQAASAIAGGGAHSLAVMA